MSKICIYDYTRASPQCGSMMLMFNTIIFLILLMPTQIKAQEPEVGVGLGVMNYAGDLSRGYDFGQLGIGANAFYKLNFNEFVGARFGLMGGNVRGSDKNPIDAFAVQRDASFSVAVLEISALFEYNFIDFRNPHSLIKWSPYLFFGIGGVGIFGDVDTEGRSTFQPVIPFGIGVRHFLGKRFTLNLEAGLRKMFFDHLDGFSDGDITNKNYQYGNKYDTDWYNFVGLSISYVLFEIPCPYDFY